MSRDYELGFILKPEVNEEQTRSIVERLEQIVTNHGGQVMRVNNWGRKRLAYPIQHHRDGSYLFIDMILTPETVSELDRTLKVSEEVLRHLIIKRDPKLVQKEREAQAAAAAQAEAQAQQPTEPEPVEDTEATEVQEVEESEENAPGENEAPASAEDEAPAALSAEEDEFVPPALEDETVEA